MTPEDKQRAKLIISEFPKWTRPMSSDEQKLVDEYHEIELANLLNESDERGYIMGVK